MITIVSIKDADYRKYDEVWAIVRSLKKPDEHWKHVPELSPSWDLFKAYLSLKEQSKWSNETFKSIYVPQFLREMRSQAARDKLNELYKLDKQGKNICLFCFCPDESLCHRSIIAGLLQGVNANVTGVKNDYSDYFTSYNTL